MSRKLERRAFLKGAAAAAFAAPRIARGAKERKLRIAIIGVGGRGSYVMGAFMGNADVQMVAVCDVREPIQFVRMRSKKHEIMIAPDANYVLIVIQNPDHEEISA